MKVDVISPDQVRRQVEVFLPAEEVGALKEEIIRDLAKNAKIKGFRPGKVPRAILLSFYKDFIADETQRRVIETTMGGALLEAEINPLVEPVVEFFEKEDGQGYRLDCEVAPEIDLPQYKGLEVEAEIVVVTDADVEKRLDGLREMHAQIGPKDGDVAEAGDFVLVKYQAYADGKPVKEVASEAYPMQLGNNTLMPEFESALVGMRTGEEKEIDLTFPDDYPDKEFASRRMLFKVTMKELRSRHLPEVNDDFAKDLNYEDLAALREGLKKEIENERETARNRGIAEKLLATMLAGVEIPVPKRFLEKRIEAALEDAQSRFAGDELNKEERAVIETGLRKEIEKREEEKIKVEILLAGIAKHEGVTVDDQDVEDRIRKVAEGAKRPFEEVKGFYEQNNFMENLRANALREKTIDFLRGQAVIREKA
jgi:trigger factor